MIDSVFGKILCTLLHETPQSRAAVFADWEGEMIDQAVNEGAQSQYESRLRAAHWGIIYFLVRTKLGPLTQSPANELFLHYANEIVLVRSVDIHYFVTLSLPPDANLGRAMRALTRASEAIREEM